MSSLKNTKRIRHRIKKKYKTLSTKNISQQSYRDNFYIWANYKWIKEVPKTLPRELQYIRPLDTFALIQDDMYKNTEDMIHDYIKQHGGPSKLNGKARQFHRMYTSLVHLDKEPILCHIENYCRTYDNMVQKNHIWKFLGYINQIEMIKWSCPIVWSVYPEVYDSSKLTPHISSPSLSLYDYRFYLDDNLIKSQMRNVKLNVKARDVYDIESELMQNMNNIDIRYDQNYSNIYSTSNHPDIQPDKVKISRKTSSYNTRNKEDCAKWSSTSKIEEDKNIPAHYSYNIRGSSRIFVDDSIAHTDIDWRELAEHVGYNKEQIPSYYISPQVGYLKTTMCKLKKEWASDRWKSYWFFIYMRQIICFHDEWREIYLDFNDTLIRGRYTHFPRKYFPIIGLAYTFPQLMNNEFTARYKNEEMISKVREIGATMVECYKKRIVRNKWLSPHTKEGALKKLNTIKFYVGETNISANDPTNLDYDPKDAWGNLMKCSIYHSQYIARHSIIAGDSKKRMLDNDDIDTINWSKVKTNGIQSYIVNAYYTANTNSIYIPTAYMHSLNIQFGRGYEYDLAALGYTIGHELSHALHVNCRTYDYKGNINDWWSPKDVVIYERKINNIRKQYEELSKKYGFVIDGKLSLSENLADITGLAVCEDALNEFHQRINGDLNLINKSSTIGDNIKIPAIPASSSAMMTDQMRRISFQHFYTYYAIQNRAIANRREMLVQVLTNPHLDLKIRTNVPLIRSSIFHDVFEISKSDKMHHGKYELDCVF